MGVNGRIALDNTIAKQAWKRGSGDTTRRGEFNVRSRSVHVLAAALAVAFPQPLLAADAPVKVSSGAALKGISRVIIGAFNVGFVFKSVDTGKTTGGLVGAFGGTTRANSELVGVTPAMMQDVTDAAYADFKAQLIASGFIVGDDGVLFSSSEFQRIKPTVAPYEAKIQLDKKSTGKATYFKPTALANQIFLPGDITASGFSGMGLNMSAGSNAYAISVIAKGNGAAIIDVTYLIDFSDLKRPGAFSFGGLQVSSGMSVADDYSRATIVTSAGKTATIVLKQPVAVEGDFAEKEDKTKGGGAQKAANIAGGIAGAFGLGGLKFGKSKTFAFTAKPAWQDGATKAATLANAIIVDRLGAMR